MAWPKETRYLGKPRPRAEAPAKVSGRAQYTSDVAPAGTLYGAILRSPWAAARIRTIDLARARRAPGIHAAISLRDDGSAIHFYGEEMAALAGTSPQAVLDALALIKVDAVPQPSVARELDAIKPEAPRVNPDEPGNLIAPVQQTTGDVAAAFASAAATVEGTFSIPVVIHMPMEPHGAVITAGPDEVTAWVSTQGVFDTRDAIASALQVPQSQVRVICEHMGGGFGGKINSWAQTGICANLSRAAGGAPVRLMLTRFDESLAVGNRPSSFQRVKLAADRAGKFTAFDLQAFGTPGWAASPGDPGGGVIDFPAPYIYAVPNTRVRRAKLATNAGPATWMRAPGHPIASVAIEGIIDELAAKLGMDPLELRLRNDPLELRQHEWRLAADKFGWKEKFLAPGSSPGPRKVGVGCAAATWGGGGGRTQADVQINPDGTVEVRCGTQDLGTGSRTVVLLVAAEILGIDADLVTVRVGDTRYPPSGTSGGSTTTASVSPAVYDACEKALEELKTISGLESVGGTAWREACDRLDAPLVVHGRWRDGLSSAGVGGVQFAEVEVDTETGFVRATRILCVQDCGLVVNPLTCESQVNGGIIMGLGLALYEQRVMDARTGFMLNPNFEQYKVPGAADVPEIDVVLLNMPERGVIGVAEPATIPTAAAVANAVANALGVRVWDLPITPDKVLAALGQLPPAGQDERAKYARELDAAFARLASAPIDTVTVSPDVSVRRRKGVYA